MEKPDKDTVNAIAKDAFLQAAEGLEVELDPDVADAMGAFTEEALTQADVMEDTLLEAENGEQS